LNEAAKRGERKILTREYLYRPVGSQPYKTLEKGGWRRGARGRELVLTQRRHLVQGEPRSRGGREKIGDSNPLGRRGTGKRGD